MLKTTSYNNIKLFKTFILQHITRFDASVSSAGVTFFKETLLRIGILLENILWSKINHYTIYTFICNSSIEVTLWYFYNPALCRK
jgi:uncharacterized membrane protein YadS